MPMELAQKIFATPGMMAFAVMAAMSLFLLAAAWSDLRHRRIPNRVVLAGTMLALLLHAILPPGSGFLSPLPGGLGLAVALKGLFFGFVVLFPLYLLHIVGAGDVKLLAMTGAFLGPVDIWWALFFTVLAGGVLALMTLLRRAALKRAVQNLKFLLGSIFVLGLSALNDRESELAERLPYGVAIAAGGIATTFYRTVWGRLF